MKSKMTLEHAMSMAKQFADEIEPYILRCEIAGSIRRRKSVVGDLELVVIAKPIHDLFGTPASESELDMWATAQQNYALAKNGKRYKQFIAADGVAIDVFIATPANYGYILMLRTGGKEFSRQMVTPTYQGGLLPPGVTVNGGSVFVGGQPVEVPDEDELFRIWGMNPIAPKSRS